MWACEVAVALVLVGRSADAFTVRPWRPAALQAAATTATTAATTTVRLDATKVGTVFGSSSGSTEDVAFLINEALVAAGGSAAVTADEPVNIDDVAGDLATYFASVDCLVVGTPTYNTDADKQRSATSWDGVYYGELEELGKAGALKGKPVAVFGLGDQEGYGENFADGCGELHDVFEAAGCRMFGYTSATEGYEHEASKSQRGDQFVGLVCDNANQDELTEGRVKAWAQQLIGEGFLGGASAAAPAGSNSSGSSSNGGLGAKTWHPESAEGDAKEADFVPYHSGVIGATLWVSTKDHRRSYYTFDKK